MPHPFQESDQVFSGEMPSRLDCREKMIEAVLRSLEKEGCRLDAFFDRLSLDEMLSNAILHGNREDPKKVVKVRAFHNRKGWGVEISDQGPGFAWEEHLRRLKKPLDQSKASGRGIALVLSTGAEVHFEDGGRTVLMVRRTGA